MLSEKLNSSSPFHCFLKGGLWAPLKQTFLTFVYSKLSYQKLDERIQNMFAMEKIRLTENVDTIFQKKIL